MPNVEKNAKIKATLLATKKRRETQKCFVFSTKINYRKLNKLQKEQLQMLFVEAKWVYNDIINHLESDKLSSWNDKKTSVRVKQKDGSFVEKPLCYIKASHMQAMRDEVRDSLNSLSAKKKKGYKVGRLKFKSSCNSIPLRQFGKTHRIKSLGKVGITGITGNFRVHGLEQFADNPNAEIVNAKLLKKPDGYYIHWTVYIFKDKLPVIQRNDEVVGIDFGCGTSFTFSDGHKEDFKLKEPECLKKLQKSLARKRKTGTGKKYSNQYKLAKKKLERAYQHLANIKNDKANKLCHRLQTYKQVVIQDENLRGWHKGGHGKAVQHSILGRVKKKLKTMYNVHVLSRFAPLNRSTLRSDAFLSHWYVYTFKAKIILRTQSRCFLEVYSRLVPTISRIVINFDTEFHHADITKTITNNDPLISIGCQTLIVLLLLQEVHNQTISSRRCATA